jgi:hypothetical protein
VQNILKEFASMAGLLLVNPKRRSRRKSKVSSHHRRRVRAKVTHRRRKRRAVAVMSNPRRRHRARAHNPRRRYRRNPSFRGLAGGIVPTLKAGAIGAVGAIGVDLVVGYSAKYLPTSMQSGIALTAAKLLAAILVGSIGNKVLRGKGRELAVGAVTVQLHDLAKAQLMAAMPSLPLGQYQQLGAYFSAGTNAMGYRNNLSTPFITTGLGGLGNARVLNAENVPGDYNDGIF